MNNVNAIKITKPKIERLDVESFDSCDVGPFRSTSNCHYGLWQGRYHVDKSNAEKAGEPALALFMNQDRKKDRIKIEMDIKARRDEEILKQREIDTKRSIENYMKQYQTKSTDSKNDEEEEAEREDEEDM